MNNPSLTETAIPLSQDAADALARAGFSRRALFKGTGALIVSFCMGGMMGTLEAQNRPVALGEGGAGAVDAPPAGEVDSWIAIGSDRSVTAYTGKEELGQGMSTAQTQLVAEELCVPFDRVNLIVCDTSMTPDQGVTSGSQSHPANFNHSNLAGACATARQALLQLGSKRLNIPVEELVAVDGEIRARSDATKKITYADLVAGNKFDLKVDPAAKRKPASEWTILGKPIGRPDMPAMVNGTFEYVQNVRVPGMLYGMVIRPSAVGANLMNVDESSVSSMPGFAKLVVKKNFVGVVAEKPWQAVQIAKALIVTWSVPPELPKQETFYDHLRNQKATRDTMSVNSKDVDEKMAEAATVVKATYNHPFQMHGSVGSSCAVADVQGDKATVWSPTQGVWHQRATLAIVLNLKPENVHVIFRRGSGCYGINGADTVTYDAALLSQATGKPVRVQLTRKEEMAWGESYGFAFTIDERAGLDPQGNIIAWDHEAWSPVLGNRPAYTNPGNVVTGFLVGFQPEEFRPRSPAPEPTVFSNNANAVPSYVVGHVGGSNHGAGTVKSERVLLHNVVSPFWTGPLRSPQRLQNTFAHESFMDELAARAKADPVEFRLRHLSEPRMVDVVKAAAKAANWDTRPSPGVRKAATTTVASGRGISCVAYEGENGFSAMVAEVEVDLATGKLTVKRVVVTVDAGPISNPDGLRNQCEGGTLQGMSRALGEEVTWDDHNITSVDWRTYHSLPLGFAVPKIEVVLLNRPDMPATGAGETAITVVAGAIGNAVFDATGVRLRQIPFSPENVKAALALRP
jgi:nicotinate dehydrogenase subunit B